MTFNPNSNTSYKANTNNTQSSLQDMLKGSGEDLEPNKPTVIKLVALKDGEPVVDQALTERETYAQRSLRLLQQE